MIANCITIGRILFSLLLIGFSTNTFPFAVFYLLCGATDVLDGFAARKLHTESEKGAMLDSTADLFFAVAYAVKILPRFFLPHWILTWALIIAVAKAAGILIASREANRIRITHSFGNKLTGILLFLLPISVIFTDVIYGATLVCITATVTVIGEIEKIVGKRKTDHTRKKRRIGQ